jgi:hypothetical protein
MLLLAAPASAHEFRNVGKYNFVVGFGTEPPFSGVPNRVQLLVSEAATEKPVADIGEDLSVEVIFGDQSQPLELEPKFVVGEFGEVGDYGADFVPTRPGKYTFHFSGSIKGQDIDEDFTSSADGFSEVLDTTAESFPVKDPSTGQLNERIDRELPRIESAASEAADDVDSAKTLTYVALGLGGLALIVALAGLGRGRKTQ